MDRLLRASAHISIDTMALSVATYAVFAKAWVEQSISVTSARGLHGVTVTVYPCGRATPLFTSSLCQVSRGQGYADK